MDVVTGSAKLSQCRSAWNLYSLEWPAEGDTSGRKKKSVSVEVSLTWVISKRFHEDFMISISRLKSSTMQHDVYFFTNDSARHALGRGYSVTNCEYRPMGRRCRWMYSVLQPSVRPPPLLQIWLLSSFKKRNGAGQNAKLEPLFAQFLIVYASFIIIVLISGRSRDTTQHEL